MQRVSLIILIAHMNRLGPTLLYLCLWEVVPAMMQDIEFRRSGHGHLSSLFRHFTDLAALLQDRRESELICNALPQPSDAFPPSPPVWKERPHVGREVRPWRCREAPGGVRGRRQCNR